MGVWEVGGWKPPLLPSASSFPVPARQVSASPAGGTEAQETSLDFGGPGGGVGGRRGGEVDRGRFPGSGCCLMGGGCFPERRGTGERAAARGTCLAFVDADAVPERGWLETLHSRLASSRPDRHGVGGGGAARGGGRGGSDAPLDRVLVVPAPGWRPEIGTPSPVAISWSGRRSSWNAAGSTRPWKWPKT